MDKALFGPPEKVRIPYEDFDYACFDQIGHCSDGRQFLALVTGAFPNDFSWQRYANPNDNEWRKDKRWIAVLHQFDADGNHLRTDARLGGYDIEGRRTAGDKALAELDKLLHEFIGNEVQHRDIMIKPFSVIIDGVTHSLEYTHFVDGEDEDEWVMLRPREIMFHPPWDSGSYST